MTDFERRLRDAAAEGTRAAHQPSFRELDRRLRRRRRRAHVAVGVLMAAVTVTGIRLGTNTFTPLVPRHGALATGTQAAPTGTGGAAVFVSPDAANPGGAVVVVGSGCLPAAAVSIDLDESARAGRPSASGGAISGLFGATATPAARMRELTVATADQHGAYHTTVHIPVDTTPGTATLWEACKAPNAAGKVTQKVTVEINPG